MIVVVASGKFGTDRFLFTTALLELVDTDMSFSHQISSEFTRAPGGRNFISKTGFW